jgi:integrase
MARKQAKDRGLFERAPGSGIWWVRHFDRNGREHREKIGAKGLARRVYEKRKTEIREGRFFAPERREAVSFESILSDYRSSALKAGREIMRGDIGYRRLHGAFGRNRANSITPAQIEAFRDRLAGELSAATVNLHLKLLRAIFMRAVRAQSVGSNPVSRVKFCKENNKRLRWLNDEEESALFEAVPNWLKPLVVVALNTGMRKGELLNLSWRDVDFTSGTIPIRDPKSGEDERVFMNATTQQTLKALRDSSTKIVQMKAGGQDRSGFVFTAPRGGFIQNLKRYWYPALRGAGVEDFHFHDLRHTFASRAAMSGVDLYTLKR